MAIWFKTPTLDAVNRFCAGNLLEHLGISFTALDDESLTATMPVDHRTHQPAGLLHGGASVALAESVASIAANLCVDMERFACVGLEINANHLRSLRSGVVTAVARPLHLGGRTQVWDVRIVDPRDRPVCVCRLTVAVVPRDHGGGGFARTGATGES